MSTVITIAPTGPIATRAGLEDCLYTRKGVLAHNRELVERTAGLAEALALQLADVKATEQRLNLPGR